MKSNYFLSQNLSILRKNNHICNIIKDTGSLQRMDTGLFNNHPGRSAAAYQLGNTSSRTITEVKQH